MCEGRASVLYLIEEKLLHHIFELREQGMAVSSRLVIIKAASLTREFRERVAPAQYARTSCLSSIMDLFIVWAQESGITTQKNWRS